MASTYQSIVIGAPADEVWAKVRDFHEASWAPNVVTSIRKVGDKGGTEVGAGRILNDAFHETLIEFSDAERSLAYSIDDGPSPVSKQDVSDYVGRLKVYPITEGSGCFVEWYSNWNRNDEAAATFCHGIYVALLRDMKLSLQA